MGACAIHADDLAVIEEDSFSLLDEDFDKFLSIEISWDVYGHKVYLFQGHDIKQLGLCVWSHSFVCVRSPTTINFKALVPGHNSLPYA